MATTKTRLDIEKDKAREKAERGVARLNKRAVEVLNSENPKLIEAVFTVLDAEDAVEGKRETKLADATVQEKREIVASLTVPSATSGYAPSAQTYGSHDDA